MHAYIHTHVLNASKHPSIHPPICDTGIAVYKDPSTPGERKGVVIGNTSSSDLKLWLESIATSPYLSSPASKLQPMPPAQSSTIFNTSNKKNNSLLDMTIIGFLNKIRSRVMKTTAPVVLARPTDTVKKIILRLQVGSMYYSRLNGLI